MNEEEKEYICLTPPFIWRKPTPEQIEKYKLSHPWVFEKIEEKENVND